MASRSAKHTHLPLLSALIFGFVFVQPYVIPSVPASFHQSQNQQTQIDPYYVRMYQQGMQAFENGRYKEAAQKLELAIFGYDDEVVKAKGAVYICLSHNRLQQTADCERFFRQAEAFVRSQSLDLLELDEATKIAFSEVWNHYYPHEVLYRPQTQQELDDEPTPQELDRDMYRLERQIKAVPNDIIAYYDLFDVYLKKQDPKNAKKTLQKMMKENPSEIMGFYHIGLLEYRSKEYKSAVKNFEKLLEKREDPNLSPLTDQVLRNAWAHLILSYNFKGDKDKALELAAEVMEFYSAEVIESLGLEPMDLAVLRELLEKSIKAL